MKKCNLYPSPSHLKENLGLGEAEKMMEWAHSPMEEDFNLEKWSVKMVCTMQ